MCCIKTANFHCLCERTHARTHDSAVQLFHVADYLSFSCTLLLQILHHILFCHISMPTLIPFYTCPKSWCRVSQQQFLILILHCSHSSAISLALSLHCITVRYFSLLSFRFNFLKSKKKKKIETNSEQRREKLSKISNDV